MDPPQSNGASITYTRKARTFWWSLKTRSSYQ